MNRIYTRLGDSGTTTLIEGERHPKHAPIFQVIGEIDELNAQLGVCVAQCTYPVIPGELLRIQHTLFALGAQLASTDADEYGASPDDISQLERWIDSHWSTTPPLTRFILPGGTLAAAQLHLARTITRRAERSLSALSETRLVHANTASYINRLSDYCFAAARAENSHAGQPERIWIAHP